MSAPLETAFYACRSMGHEWRHAAALGQDEVDRSVPSSLDGGVAVFPSVCSNCGTERLRWISRSGATEVRYTYPDGYSRTGEDRLSAAGYREAFVAAVFASFDQRAARRRRRRTTAA